MWQDLNSQYQLQLNVNMENSHYVFIVESFSRKEYFILVVSPFNGETMIHMWIANNYIRIRKNRQQLQNENVTLLTLHKTSRCPTILHSNQLLTDQTAIINLS